MTNKGGILTSALERYRNRIDTTNIIYNGEFLEDSEEIKEAVKESANKWTRKRRVNLNDEWLNEMTPRDYIDDDTFNDCDREIQMNEISEALMACPINKAAGASGIPYECWKKAHESVLHVILHLFNLCLKFRITPFRWRKANIILIPKSRDWGKDVDVTRPITLIETLRKVFSRVLTQRIERVCREHNVLRGNNSSVLKGTSTHCAISIMSQICEEAEESNEKQAWIVLQDMRKAYDSVSWEGLEKALKRIKMKLSIIDILEGIHNNRYSAVITDHGPTDYYEVQDGIDQGEVYSPLLWRIFYDPLLCRIQRTQKSNGYTLDNNGNGYDITINHLAFVDDTAWIAKSRKDMESILVAAKSFYVALDVEINDEKTKCIVVTGRKAKKDQIYNQKRLKFGNSGNTIEILPPDKAVRYLGVWFNGKYDPLVPFNLLREELRMTCKILERKPLSDKIVSYIIRTVLWPIAEYRLKCVALSDDKYAALESPAANLLRKAMNLSRETAAGWLFHPDVLNIPKMKQIQVAARISELLYDLNSKNLEGEITRRRAEEFQIHRWTKFIPWARPLKTCRSRKFKFFNRIQSWLAETKCAIWDTENTTWSRPVPQNNDLETIEDALGPHFDYRRAAQFLRRDNIMYMSQVINPDGSLKRLTALRRELGRNTRGRPPLWYKSLEAMNTSRGGTTSTLYQNKHKRKWLKTTEAINEIQTVDHQTEDELDTRCNAIGIHPDQRDEWKTVRRRLAEVWHNQTTPLQIYTDGSYNHQETHPALANMAAAFYCTEADVGFTTSCGGEASSTNPEAKAILLAVEALPVGCTVDIHSDSQAALSIFEKIVDGKYNDITIRSILKQRLWQTWEAIQDTITEKKLNINPHKVKSHMGIAGNEEADILAKKGIQMYSQDKKLKICNTPTSRIAFTLAHRGELIESNPRHGIIAIIDNVKRARWLNSERGKRITSGNNALTIDWETLRKLINQDGPPRGGFSLKKYSDTRSYITKLITGTLPTMDILHMKWGIYDSNECPNGCGQKETNDHLWNCPATADILEEALSKGVIASGFKLHKNQIVDLFKGNAKKEILKSLNNNEPCTAKTVNKIVEIIDIGKTEIWKRRCEAAAKMIKDRGITARNKRPRQSKRRQIPKDGKEIQDKPETNDVFILIKPNRYFDSFDPYRCWCGKHSMLHTPGKNCSLDGLIENRAIDIFTSSRLKLTKVVPFIIDNQVALLAASR